jgi:hypothetical protein
LDIADVKRRRFGPNNFSQVERGEKAAVLFSDREGKMTMIGAEGKAFGAGNSRCALPPNCFEKIR